MAAGNAIASGAVVITANADGLAGGLNQAGQQVEGWGKGVSSKLGTVMKGGLVGVGLKIADTVLGLPGKVLGKFEDLKEGIDHASKAARAFGTDMTTWQGIVHAADLSGVGVEQLEAGLTRFRKNVEGPIDEALYAFAKRLEGIQDPGERAAILVDNFGKSGLKLAGLFEGGEEGLRKLVAEAESLGFALSEADGKAIEEANDAVRRTEKAVEGLWNRLVVALAPAFQYVAELLTEWVKKGQPVFDWLSRAFTQYYELAAKVWEAVGEAVESVWEEIKGMAGGLFDFAAGMPTVQEVIVMTFRAVGTTIAYVWDILKAGAGVASIAASAIVTAFGYVVEAFKEVVNLAKELPDDLRPDWIDDFSAGIQRFEDRVKQAGEEMRDWGKGVIAGMGSSAKQFNSWLDRALMKKKELDQKSSFTLGGTFGKDPMKFAAAIEKGSKEAYTLSVRNRFGADIYGDSGDVKDELKKNGKKQDKGNDHLKGIEKRLKDLEEI